MSTDFTNNGTTILSSGGFKPSAENTPLDARTRVNLKADIDSIPNPFVGMHIVVLQDETNDNEMTEYIVKSLTSNSLGVADAKINEVELVKDFLGIANSSDDSVDLSEYVTKTELNENLSTKANVSHTHDQYLTEHQDLSDYALKTELPTVPTKVSELANDSGFITSVPSEYITETELSAKSYATETYVTNKIAEASLDGKEVDLSGLATKDELATKADKTAIPTKTSQLTNDSGFLTEHQNISSKADKTYVDNQLATKSDTDHTHSYNDLTDKPTIPSTTNLATKTELTNGLATKADKVHTHDQYLTEHQDLSDYALKNEIPNVPTKVSQLTNDKGYLTSVPSEYATETELNDAISGFISSDIIKAIVIVDALPEVEVEGVLYLVKGGTSTDTPDEPTVTNLYPGQTTLATSDGFTITFTERNVTIDGQNDAESIQCQTKQFTTALAANKAYYLQFTNTSGSFDDSNRVSQSDGMICMVALTGYDSSDEPKTLIDWVERDASGIYNKFTFTPDVDCIKGKLTIQAKKLTSFSNWTCSIVIAEEGV